MESVVSPPIEVINARAAKLARRGARVINLGQGVPGFPMATGAVETARKALEEQGTHVYSPDPGLLPLREALSAALATQNRIAVDPASEIIITAGASQAFFLALLTLLEPGDKVLLPSPYYFNHEMAVRIVGGVPVEVPLSEGKGFGMCLEDLEPYLDQRPRAVVVISPNNPTGAVYEPRELQRIGRALASRGIAIIADETYRDFVYEGAQHLSLASVADIRSQLITIGSFSKSLSMTGWRVGYFIAEAPFIREALKVQDAMVVCAPVISQKAALGGLQRLGDEVAHRRDMLNERRLLLAERLDGIAQLAWQPTLGAYFAFVRVEGCSDSASLALDILDQVHVVTIPGRTFGRHGEGYLRLSYGTVDLATLQEACTRLGRYFTGA
jgi:aspartate aminotransferase